MTSIVPKLARLTTRRCDRWKRAGTTVMDRGFATSTSTSNDQLKVSPTTTQQMPPGTFAPQITKPWCEALVELSQPSATDACLDLASGGGVNAFVIADAIEEAKLWGPPAGAGALGGAHNLAGSVLGLDRSREALSKAKEALKAKQLKGEGSVPVRFEWADAVDKDSPWHETKKKRFARAYCDNGMQFFQNPEEACKRVRESLIPGGAFVVSIWGPLRPETQPLFYSAYTAMAEVLNGMDNSDSWVNASRAETIAQFGDPFSWVSATDQNPNSSAIERLEEVLIKSGFDAPDAATEKASHARFENLEQAAAACVGSMSFLEKFKTLNSGDAYAQFLESFERQLLQNAGSSEVIQFEAQPGSTTVGQKGEGSFISVPATAYFAHATAPWSACVTGAHIASVGVPSAASRLKTPVPPFRGNAPSRNSHNQKNVAGTERITRRSAPSRLIAYTSSRDGSLNETTDQAVQMRSNPLGHSGYFRWPALHNNTLVFVCEDDLHCVDVRGGLPRRITDAPGPTKKPVFSPCGSHLAFTVEEDECEEVYVVHVKGGPVVRITHVGAERVRVASWSPDGTKLFFVSSAQQHFVDVETLFYVQIVWEGEEGDRSIVGASEPTRAELGPAHDAQFQPGGFGKVIGRNTHDPATANWKGYKGGASGEVWVDLTGNNTFERLAVVDKDNSTKRFNIGDVVWATKERIVCIADDGDGRAQLYSFLADGKKARLTKHTARRDFCVRHLCADQAVDPDSKTITVAYVAGGKLFTSVVTFDDENSGVVGSEVPIEWRGPKAQLEKFKLDEPNEFIDDINLHPEGLTTVVVTRGRVFTMGLWDGPSVELEAPCVSGKQFTSDSYGKSTGDESLLPPGSRTLFEIAGNGFLGEGGSGVTKGVTPQSQNNNPYAPRARLASYLWDATRVLIVRDGKGEDDLEVHWTDGSREARLLNVPPGVLGRPLSITSSTESPLVAIVNHRAELLLIDCDTGGGDVRSEKNGKNNAEEHDTKKNNPPVIRLCDTSHESSGIKNVVWSPCGCWIAYTWYSDCDLSLIRVVDVRSGEVHDITHPVLGDSCPAWDPEGNYLYFLSSRELEPAYDSGKLGLSFHGVLKPHCVSLRPDVKNPLLKRLRPPHDGSDDDDDESEADADSASSDSDASACHSDAPPPISIDFNNIGCRVLALPMPSGRYANLLGLDHGNFCLLKFQDKRPGRVGLDVPYYADSASDDGSAGGDGVSLSTGGALLKFDLGNLKTSVLVESGVRSVSLSMDRRCTLLEKIDQGSIEYRALKAGSKFDDEDSDGEEIDFDLCNKRSGLLDLESRIQIVVDPLKEWTQMFVEAWRVLRDEWVFPGMDPGDTALESRGDDTLNDSNSFKVASTQNATPNHHLTRWNECLRKYAHLVLPRVGARSELDDVFDELAAELRSSHVSISTGDLSSETRRRHSVLPGRLGCDVRWVNIHDVGNDGSTASDGSSSASGYQSSSGGYQITKLITGDLWDNLSGGCLVKPGVNISVGDVILKINGRRLTKTFGASEALVGAGGKEVLLTVLVGERSDGSLDNAFDELSLKGKKGKVSRDVLVSKNKASKNPQASHPKFTPNPASVDCDLRRVPGTVITTRVRAMYSELDARYRDLIATRNSRVAELSGNKVGYLHVPDMERFGYSEFWRRFPNESKKHALIVDLRGNGGGHISELILQKLTQKPFALDVPRRGEPVTYPSHAMVGPVVTIVDQDTGSDAELLAISFRQERGTGNSRIVGVTTWGGLLTVSDGGVTLVDGGYVSFPSQNVVVFGGNGDDKGNSSKDSSGSSDNKNEKIYKPGNLVENRGVVPDVSVEVSPSDYLKGVDPQLDTAVMEALSLLGVDVCTLGQSDIKSQNQNVCAADSRRALEALKQTKAKDGSHTQKNKNWPFKTFAPYPGDESSESSSESELDSDDDARRKPKGASRRR